MMLFALAGNMGGLGASGFTAPAAGLAAAVVAPVPALERSDESSPAKERPLAKAYRLSRLESAAAPIPNPACLKK